MDPAIGLSRIEGAIEEQPSRRAAPAWLWPANALFLVKDIGSVAS